MHKLRGSISEMARRQRPWSLWRPLMLIYLCAPSSTTALSMSNFQIITSQTVSSKCMRAYSTTISGCAITDFIFGSGCSTSCVQGLQVTAERIERACRDEDVNSGSLLCMILEGKLVDVLCPSNPKTSTFTTTIQATTDTEGFITASQDTTTLPDTTPTSLPTTQTPDTTFISATTTSSSLAQPSTTDITSITSISTSTILPTFSLRTSPTSTATPTATTTPPPSTVEDTQPENTEESDGPDFLPGGGSPFDAVPVLNSGEGIRQPLRNIVASLLAVSVIAMLL